MKGLREEPRRGDDDSSFDELLRQQQTFMQQRREPSAHMERTGGKKISLFRERKMKEREDQRQRGAVIEREPELRGLEETNDGEDMSAVIRDTIVEHFPTPGDEAVASEAPKPFIPDIPESGFPKPVHRSLAAKPKAQPGPPPPPPKPVPPRLSRGVVEAEGEEFARQMERDNLRALEQMSADEIREAQESLRKMLPQSAYEALRNRGAAGSTEDRQPAPAERRQADVPSPASEPARAAAEPFVKFDISGGTFGLGHLTPSDVARLEWTNPPAPEENFPLTEEAEESAGEGKAATAVLKLHHLRFDFKGQLCTDLRRTDDGQHRDESSDPLFYYRGLHHHGEDPSLPGYTLNELLHLARSAASSQRRVALQTLAAVLGNARKRVPVHPSGTQDGMAADAEWACGFGFGWNRWMRYVVETLCIPWKLSSLLSQQILPIKALAIEALAALLGRPQETPEDPDSLIPLSGSDMAQLPISWQGMHAFDTYEELGFDACRDWPEARRRRCGPELFQEAIGGLISTGELADRPPESSYVSRLSEDPDATHGDVLADDLINGLVDRAGLLDQLASLMASISDGSMPTVESSCVRVMTAVCHRTPEYVQQVLGHQRLWKCVVHLVASLTEGRDEWAKRQAHSWSRKTEGDKSAAQKWREGVQRLRADTLVLIRASLQVGDKSAADKWLREGGNIMPLLRQSALQVLDVPSGTAQHDSAHSAAEISAACEALRLWSFMGRSGFFVEDFDAFFPILDAFLTRTIGQMEMAAGSNSSEGLLAREGAVAAQVFRFAASLVGTEEVGLKATAILRPVSAAVRVISKLYPLPLTTPVIHILTEALRFFCQSVAVSRTMATAQAPSGADTDGLTALEVQWLQSDQQELSARVACSAREIVARLMESSMLDMTWINSTRADVLAEELIGVATEGGWLTPAFPFPHLVASSGPLSAGEHLMLRLAFLCECIRAIDMVHTFPVTNGGAGQRQEILTAIGLACVADLDNVAEKMRLKDAVKCLVQVAQVMSRRRRVLVKAGFWEEASCGVLSLKVPLVCAPAEVLATLLLTCGQFLLTAMRQRSSDPSSNSASMDVIRSAAAAALATSSSMSTITSCCQLLVQQPGALLHLPAVCAGGAASSLSTAAAFDGVTGMFSFIALAGCVPSLDCLAAIMESGLISEAVLLPLRPYVLRVELLASLCGFYVCRASTEGGAEGSASFLADERVHGWASSICRIEKRLWPAEQADALRARRAWDTVVTSLCATCGRQADEPSEEGGCDGEEGVAGGREADLPGSDSKSVADLCEKVLGVFNEVSLCDEMLAKLVLSFTRACMPLEARRLVLNDHATCRLLMRSLPLSRRCGLWGSVHEYLDASAVDRELSQSLVAVASIQADVLSVPFAIAIHRLASSHHPGPVDTSAIVLEAWRDYLKAAGSVM
ncbi:unnamed protein product [Vitrella brassicaformis CCMP3155]|uniref:RPAP1 C-terminal domain-containing protein n=1 Tax=Vitrella brassicaformis (strain CCMP3155) TaxID=1169540 RepID=A0A0G4EDU8_VITBC|nr:unnamed protein product [Vitrella brassicaformis CCMP3155]|eukprot:CEL94125.1 unnamed protein product [Vitrella brassicaformis CCMP3155]